MTRSAAQSHGYTLVHASSTVSPNCHWKTCTNHDPLFCALSLSLSARTAVKPGTKILSVSSMSHVSVKHIKLLRRKSPSNRTSAVNSSSWYCKARTFDRVIMGTVCLLPRVFLCFSVALSLLLSIHGSCSFSRFQSLQQCHKGSVSNPGAVSGVGRKTKTLVSSYARWRVCRVRVHPQRKSPAQSHTEGSTPPQTEYTSLPSSYTCMHTFTNVQRPQETQQNNDEKANWRATGQPQSCAPFSIANNIRCSARSGHLSQILRALHWPNFLSNPAFSIKLLFLPLNKRSIN